MAARIMFERLRKEIFRFHPNVLYYKSLERLLTVNVPTDEDDFLARMRAVLRKNIGLPEAEVEYLLRRYKYYLRDIKRGYLSTGKSESEAWKATLEDFGDPKYIVEGYSNPIGSIIFGDWSLSLLFGVICFLFMFLNLTGLASRDLAETVTAFCAGGILGSHLIYAYYRNFWSDFLAFNHTMISRLLVGLFVMALVAICVMALHYIYTTTGIPWNFVFTFFLTSFIIQLIGFAIGSQTITKSISKLLIRRGVDMWRY